MYFLSSQLCSLRYLSPLFSLLVLEPVSTHLFNYPQISPTPFRHTQMKYLAAYLLLQTGGNASPAAGDIKELLATVGIESEDARIEKLIAELEGKDINEVSCRSTEISRRANKKKHPFQSNR